jgi:hypothetical protein
MDPEPNRPDVSDPDPRAVVFDLLQISNVCLSFPPPVFRLGAWEESRE